MQGDARDADHGQCPKLEGGLLELLRQGGDQAQGAFEVVDRLLIGVAPDGARARQQQIIDGLAVLAGKFGMPGNQFRRRLRSRMPRTPRRCRR